MIFNTKLSATCRNLTETVSSDSHEMRITVIKIYVHQDTLKTRLNLINVVTVYMRNPESQNTRNLTKLYQIDFQVLCKLEYFLHKTKYLSSVGHYHSGFGYRRDNQSDQKQ